jgi:hypothetical protein
MAEKKKRESAADSDKQQMRSGGGVPAAVPPPDDPMRRNEGEQGDIGSAEAALLRAEAIRRTRLMPSDDGPAPPKKPR